MTCKDTTNYLPIISLRHFDIFIIFVWQMDLINRTLYFLANTPYDSPEMIAVLVVVGFFVGLINTVAGMASIISYALFMAMGMPINVANGTTRLGVLLQYSAASIFFKRKGFLKMNLAIKISIPIALGSFLGAELVTYLPQNIVEITMGVMLPFIGVLLMLDNKKFRGDHSIDEIEKVNIWKWLIFLLIGIYGGFTHVGVGLLIIFGAFMFLGLDLVSANGIKQFAVAVYTPVTLVVFALNDEIIWPVAIIFAIGNVIGGVVGSAVSVKWGGKFIKWFVLIVSIIMAFWLIGKQFS